MNFFLPSRRDFVISTAALSTTAAIAAGPSLPLPDTDGAQRFIDAWDAAWTHHDATAIAALHTNDAITVNRFGTVVNGRTALERALGFLHGPDGPFHRSVFPRQTIIAVRMVAPTVMIVQTKWKNPMMKPDGKIDPASTNDMVVTFVLVQRGTDWQATEVNLVNVEKMDLPFSNPGQH